MLGWTAYLFSGTTTTGEATKRFLLTTGSIVLSVLLLEFPAWLHLIDYRRAFGNIGQQIWTNPYYPPQEHLPLWMPRRHAQLSGLPQTGNIGVQLCWPAQRPAHDLQYDGQGFRNAVDLEQADIGVIGDSYVEAPTVPSSSMLTTVLAELQGRTVANLGMSGYGPHEEFLVLQHYALPLRPQTVIWMFYGGNDLPDVSRSQALQETWPSVLARSHSVWQRSFTKNLLEITPRLLSGCRPNPSFEKRYGTVRDTDGQVRRIYFGEHGRPLRPYELQALEETGRLLRQAYELCRRYDIRLVFVFIPTTFRVYAGLADLSEADEDVRSWVVNDLPERLKTMVAHISSEIPILDLTLPLQAAAQRGVSVFLSDDSHWSAEGHQLAAEVIDETLARPANERTMPTSMSR